MERDEHLTWAKERAFKETTSMLMWISFSNDLDKHPDLKDHDGLIMVRGVDLTDKDSVKRFIDGFK